MFVHRRHARSLALACTAAALALVAALAPPAGAHDGPLISQELRGAWLGRWWSALLETPSPQDRYPGCVALGLHAVGVVFPPFGGQGSCRVPVGSRLVLVPDTAECSDYEDPPFFGATPAERRACATAGTQGSTVHEVTVDGQRRRLTNAYHAHSRDQRVRLPEDNLLGAPAGTWIQFGADGWLAFTQPLMRGHHAIVEHAAGTFAGEPYDATGSMDVDVR